MFSSTSIVILRIGCIALVFLLWVGDTSQATPQSTAPPAVPSSVPAETLTQASNLMREAQSAFQGGDFATAAKAFEQIIRLLPKDARAHFGLGLSLASIGKTEQAHVPLAEANKLSPANAEILLALAQLETSLGLTGMARERLSEAEKIRPGDTRLGLLRVQTYLAEGNARSAIDEVAEVSKTSADAPTHVQLAALLVRMGAWQQATAEYDWIDQRDAALAEEAIAKGLLVGGSSPEFRDSLLRWFQQKGRLGRAAAVFQKLSRDDPDNPDFRVGLIQAHTLDGNIDSVRGELRELSRRVAPESKVRQGLGQFFLASGQEDLALGQFLRAYQNGLENPQLALQLAGLQGQAGAYQDAIQTASRVEQQAILPAQIRSAAALLVGTSSMSAGQEQDAINHLQKAIQFSPEIEANYLALAQVYEVLGEPQKVVDVLRSGMPRIVPSPDYKMALGRGLLANDEYEAAAAVLSDLIEIHPNMLEAYLPLARVYHLINQPEQEIRTMRRLTKLRPEYPMLPMMLAQSLMDAAEYDAALEALERAEQATPSDAEVFLLRGRIFQSMGRLDDSEVQLRRSIELRPTDPALRYQLALLYRRMGKEDLALEQIEKKNYLESALIPDLTRPN